MNNNAQNGSFCNVTDNQILLTDTGQDAFYHASNSHPQMVGFAQIVRVNPSSQGSRAVIIFNNSNFAAVKKTALMRMGGLNPQNPPLATPLCHSLNSRTRLLMSTKHGRHGHGVTL